MKMGSTFKPNSQTTKLMQPSNRAFHDPPIATQPTTMFGVAPRQKRFNAAFAQGDAMRFRVVSPIRIHLIRTATRSAGFAAHGWNGIDQGQQWRDVVDIGRSQLNDEWNALGIRDKVVFAARTGSIGGIGTGLFAPKTARTLELSTTARDQSMTSIWFSRASMTSCNCCHTPACCHAFSRRQHVMPDPQPISWGRSSHGIPVFNTNKMPVSALRLSTGLRPGCVLRRGLTGINGSIKLHKSSSTNAFAISVD